jgi:hypothetical protein
MNNPVSFQDSLPAGPAGSLADPQAQADRSGCRDTGRRGVYSIQVA